MAKEQVKGMNKRLMAMLGALSLVACSGSGKTWDGGAPDLDDDWSGPGTVVAGSSTIPAAGTGTGVGGYEAGGSYAVGGTGYGVGGYEAGGSYGVGGTGYGVGGYEAGGSYAVGGYEAGGGYGVGGTGYGVGGYEAGGGYGFGGTGVGGGGYAGTGTGPQDPLCLQNVVHCFDAAANCYQYSPTSDCDQIVDVCAAMQMDCE